MLLLAEGRSYAATARQVALRERHVRKCGPNGSFGRALQGSMMPLVPAARRSFPPEAAVHLVKIACELPDRLGRSLSQWDCVELARQLVDGGVVKSLSPQTVERILNDRRLKPWRRHLWHVPRDAAFAACVGHTVDLYTRPLEATEQVLCCPAGHAPQSRVHDRMAGRRREEATEVFRERYRLRRGLEGTNRGWKRRTGLGRLRVRGRRRGRKDRPRTGDSVPSAIRTPWPRGVPDLCPHQVTGFDALVHGALFTVRTGIPRLERLVRYPYLRGAPIVFGTIAAVPWGPLRRREFLIPSSVAAPGLLFLAGLVQNPLDHLACRLRGRPEQQSKPPRYSIDTLSDNGVLGLQSVRIEQAHLLSRPHIHATPGRSPFRRPRIAPGQQDRKLVLQSLRGC